MTMKKRETKKVKISELDRIYTRWGEGPSPEQYYEAVRRYFAAKETHYVGEPVVESSTGQTARVEPA